MNDFDGEIEQRIGWGFFGFFVFVFQLWGNDEVNVCVGFLIEQFFLEVCNQFFQLCFQWFFFFGFIYDCFVGQFFGISKFEFVGVLNCFVVVWFFYCDQQFGICLFYLVVFFCSKFLDFLVEFFMVFFGIGFVFSGEEENVNS